MTDDTSQPGVRKDIPFKLIYDCLSPDGEKSARLLAQLQFAFPHRKPPTTVLPREVTPNMLVSEAKRIARIADVSQREAEVRSILESFVEMTDRAQVLAQWSLDANETLTKLPAYVAAMAQMQNLRVDGLKQEIVDDDHQ